MPGAKGQQPGHCGDLSLEQVREMRASGMTVREVADKAGICEESVKSCCHRNGIHSSWGGGRRRGVAAVLHSVGVELPSTQLEEPTDEPSEEPSVAQLQAVIIEQARIITDLDCARSDIVEMTTHPLNFMRALLNEAREVLGPAVTIGMYEAAEKGMCMTIGMPGARSQHFEVTDADYAKGFDQYLAEILKAMT